MNTPVLSSYPFPLFVKIASNFKVCPTPSVREFDPKLTEKLTRFGELEESVAALELFEHIFKSISYCMQARIRVNNKYERSLIYFKQLPEVR